MCMSLLTKGHVKTDNFYLASDSVKSHTGLFSASNSKVKLCVDAHKCVQVSVQVCMGVQVCVDVSAGVCTHVCERMRAHMHAGGRKVASARLHGNSVASR